jgi:hypothetical protein
MMKTGVVMGGAAVTATAVTATTVSVGVEVPHEQRRRRQGGQADWGRESSQHDISRIC